MFPNFYRYMNFLSLSFNKEIEKHLSNPTQICSCITNMYSIDIFYKNL